MSKNGTLGRVYGGAPELLHYRDGTRVEAGREVAGFIERQLRERNGGDRGKALCPGCYMVAIFNAAVTLAQENGQSVTELGRSLGAAFSALCERRGDLTSEEIMVLLDPDDLPPEPRFESEDERVARELAHAVFSADRARHDAYGHPPVTFERNVNEQ